MEDLGSPPRPHLRSGMAEARACSGSACCGASLHNETFIFLQPPGGEGQGAPRDSPQTSEGDEHHLLSGAKPLPLSLDPWPPGLLSVPYGFQRISQTLKD